MSTSTPTILQGTQTAFKASYPLQFTLKNEQQQAVLYIGEESNTLTLQITNQTALSYSIAVPSPGKPVSATNYQIELRFRPSTLKESPTSSVKVSDSGWSAAYQLQSNGTQSAYLLNANPLKWAANKAQGDELSLTLTNIFINPAAGSRVTNVEMLYRHLLADNAASGLSGSRTQIMQIITGTASDSRSAAPFFFTINGSNQILNDGKTKNTFSLMIGSLGSQPIPLSTDASAPTTFFISFDGGEFSSKPHWALAKINSLQAMQVTPPHGWSVTPPSDNSQSTQWTLEATQSAASLTQPICITFAGLITQHPAEPSKALLHYQNIPNHDDGDLVVFLEKTSVAYAANNGVFELIGQLAAKNTMQPAPILKTDQNSVTIDGTASLPYPCVNDNGVLIGDAQSGNYAGLFIAVPQNPGASPFQINDSASAILLIVRPNGHVGIGTGSPKEELDVNGNVASAGRYQDKTGYVMPVGSIIAYGGATVPEGWRLCDGSQIPSGNTDLINVVGQCTPDLRSRFIIGAGQGNGLSNYQSSATGGEEQHTLAENEMPSHTHAYMYRDPTGIADSGNYYSGGYWEPTNVNSTTESAGGNQSHNNLPPYYALTYIIKC